MASGFNSKTWWATRYIRKFATLAAIPYKNLTPGCGIFNGQFYARTSTVALTDAGTLSTVTGLTCKEYGYGGILHQTVFTLTALPLTLADATVGAGVQIYTYPQGQITILGGIASIAETTTSTLASTLNASVTINYGVGTTTQANGALATTEQDQIPTTNTTASATINVAGAASVGPRAAAPANFNGNTAAIKAFFNVGVATATDIDGDATTLYTGTIVLTWLFNGLV